MSRKPRKQYDDDDGRTIANMNVDVVDLGVPVLSMHAPFEIVSKTDVYMAYRAFFTFFDTKD